MAWRRLQIIVGSCLHAKSGPEADSRRHQARNVTSRDIGPKRSSANGRWKKARYIGRRLRHRIMGGGDALPEAELADACSRLVTAVFPNICPQFLEQLASSIGLDASAIINHIVDQEAEGKPYPRSQAPNALKRKRGTLDDEAQEVARVKRIYDVSGRRPRVLTHRLAHQM